MASPDDRRVRRTRAAIQQALLALMLEKGYEAVSATDIIERADVGRSTFYAHFTDKQQVLFDSLDELASFLRAHRGRPGDELFAFSRPMFEHAHEQRLLLGALFGRKGGGNVVQARMGYVLGELAREDLTTLAAGQTPRVRIDLIVTAVVGAYLALLGQWVDSAETSTPTDMDATFRALVIPGVRQAILPARPPAPTTRPTVTLRAES
jgi:AcrR family transcriptional regulator